MQLSPAQQAAVEHTGSPALVVAGAGIVVQIMANRSFNIESYNRFAE